MHTHAPPHPAIGPTGTPVPPGPENTYSYLFFQARSLAIAHLNRIGYIDHMINATKPFTNHHGDTTQSQYTLVMRYRKPRKGKAWGNGSLKCENARVFSIYVRERQDSRDARWRALQDLNRKIKAQNALPTSPTWARPMSHSTH